MQNIFYVSPNNEIFIDSDDVEIIDTSEYKNNVAKYFSSKSGVANQLITLANGTFNKIKNMLYAAPSFVNELKSIVPEETLQAVLTDEQKSKLASGSLELMTKKDGSLMATLINPETKRIVAHLEMESVKVPPDISQAITNYTSQMQMAQIAEQIQLVQLAIEEVRQGQENDRLALAYSCQQKLLQAMSIKNPDLKKMLLMQVISDAEDSRNKLMLSQNVNIEFIKEQPESLLAKLIKGDSAKKINSRMNEIRDSLCAVNIVSMSAAIAFQEMGEPEAARQSLLYYADYINKAYLSTPGLINRLDMIDSSPENYWSKTLPDIQKNIQALPCYKVQLLEDGKNEEKL